MGASYSAECLTVRTESGVNFANLMSVRLNCFRKWVSYPRAVPSCAESSLHLYVRDTVPVCECGKIIIVIGDRVPEHYDA